MPSPKIEASTSRTQSQLFVHLIPNMKQIGYGFLTSKFLVRLFPIFFALCFIIYFEARAWRANSRRQTILNTPREAICETNDVVSAQILVVPSNTVCLDLQVSISFPYTFINTVTVVDTTKFVFLKMPKIALFNLLCQCQ